MASNRTKFSVGIFLIAGVCLAVAAVIWVGMSGYLEKGKLFVVYFDESVQGMDRDSSVKYRGVNVGRVERLEVAPDGILIEAILKIDPERMDPGLLVEKDGILVKRHDITGVYAQIKNVGITGLRFVELDRLPPRTEVVGLDLDFKPPYPVIPSRPSEFKQIFDEAEAFFARVRSIDYEGIAERFRKNLDDLHAAVAAADVAGISSRFKEGLDNLNNILENQRWDRILESVEVAGQNVDKAAIEAGKTFDAVTGTVGEARSMIEENRQSVRLAVAHLQELAEQAGAAAQQSAKLVASTEQSVAQLARHLTVAAQNVERASRNLDELLEELSRDPALLLRGEPPRPRSFEGH
jgi:phospholipid/cholesterol/gamma-HCH transport system substrate-binding protein